MEGLGRSGTHSARVWVFGADDIMPDFVLPRNLKVADFCIAFVAFSAVLTSSV